MNARELDWVDVLDLDWETELILIDADWAREQHELDREDT